MTTPPRSIRLNVNAAIVRNEEILVIEFRDENGFHYNLPGGGVDSGESLEIALLRECREEACADVSVGRLLLVWEYVPELHGGIYGPTQKVGHIFECQLKPGSEPALPGTPDPNQVGVRWIPLSALKELPSPRYHPLFPTIGRELLDALMNGARPLHVISRV